ncbi:MAG: ADP-ribosylation factor-like protein, partial [Candidatus Hodarchaeota archaeon]
LKTFSLAMKSTKGLYKGFYLGKDQEAKDSSKANDTIRKLSADCYEACRRKPEAQKPGKMLILGLRAVGKSSLLNQVTAQKYNPKIKPTLGTQIIRSAVDNFKFNIYDLGGQEKIREGWYKKNIEPNAIIFVIDVSADKSQHDVAKEEFVRMCENFFGKNAAQKIPEDTPVLILGNKIDLNEKFTEKDIEKLLNPKKHKLNYRIGLTSALNADGIEENFKWLVKAFLFV